MAETRVDGIALGAIGAGALLLYSGIQGKSITSELQGLVKGQNPSQAASANQITSPGGSGSSGGSGGSGGSGNFKSLPGPGSTGSGGSNSANEALGRLLAAPYGWATGTNWQALNYGWGTLESGWNSHAQNPSSPAYGIAQALGHGGPDDQGSESDSYGGWGLSHSEAKQANSGDAYWQIVWGLRYIKDSYGSPSQVPGWLGGPYGGY